MIPLAASMSNTKLNKNVFYSETSLEALISILKTDLDLSLQHYLGEGDYFLIMQPSVEVLKTSLT